MLQKMKEGLSMASKTETYYPPYEGDEPYIHLCFSSRDERKVRPLLRKLMLRGCRVWYCIGGASDRRVQMARSERMLKAGLTVLFLTASVRQDTELKNRLLVCQKAKQPILVLNTDGGDSSLSLGLTGVSSAAVMGGNASDALDAILHGQGFSQVFMGDPLPVNDRLWLRRISVLLLVLSLLLAGAGGAYLYLNPPEILEPLPEDTVIIEDRYLRDLVREVIGGGPITEEALAQIETLNLSQLPRSAEDLSVLPNLTTLILSEEAAQAAPGLPKLYEAYTLVVTGGESQ